MMKHNVLLLSSCQALMMSANSLLIASAALVGVTLADDPAMATLPIALLFVGVLSCTFPASMLMKIIGRRGGFLFGLLFGAAGAAIAATAIYKGSFAGFCLGTLSIGVFNGFGQYYRFAAADVAAPGYRSRAIAYVMAGGVVAAFVGPNLARVTRGMLPSAEFAASFAALVALYALSMLALAFARIPPTTVEERSGTARPLPAIGRQPKFLVAVVGATIAYGVMNLMMTATPLAMAHHGHEFGDTAFVIQWHVFGMFAPSFATGHLIRRFGIANIMLTGSALIATSIGANLLGAAVPHFWSALVFLGVGWNFLFLGATTLLTETYAPAEKAKTQGLNDLLVFTTVAVTALSSGYLHHQFGWETLNYVLVPWIFLAMGAALWLKRFQQLALIPR
jgi:MFS family permease